MHARTHAYSIRTRCVNKQTYGRRWPKTAKSTFSHRFSGGENDQKMHEDDDYFNNNNNKKTSQNAANDYCTRSRFLVCSDCREFQTTKMNGVPRNLVSKSFLQQDDINYRLVIDFIPGKWNNISLISCI